MKAIGHLARGNNLLKFIWPPPEDQHSETGLVCVAIKIVPEKSDFLTVVCAIFYASKDSKRRYKLAKSKKIVWQKKNLRKKPRYVTSFGSRKYLISKFVQFLAFKI